jgi:hypothetical protein
VLNIAHIDDKLVELHTVFRRSLAELIDGSAAADEATTLVRVLAKVGRAPFRRKRPLEATLDLTHPIHPTRRTRPLLARGGAPGVPPGRHGLAIGQRWHLINEAVRASSPAFTMHRHAAGCPPNPVHGTSECRCSRGCSRSRPSARLYHP